MGVTDRSGKGGGWPLEGSTLSSPGDFAAGQITVATAGTCVAITTSQSYSPNGVLLSVVDSSTFYIQSAGANSVGDDLRSRGVVCKNNNPVFIHTNNPNSILVDCTASDKDISWCIM